MQLLKINFLVPSLQSNWLFMHVTSIIISYAFLICGTFIALFFLFKEQKFNNKNNILKSEEQQVTFNSNQLIKLDNLSYRLISIGFPLLTIGIISGAVWANEAWGSYWSWDPKETWALITWILFAIYIHTRLFYNWQGKNSAILASISLIILLICFFGVNFMSKGLHSYGFFKVQKILSQLLIAKQTKKALLHLKGFCFFRFLDHFAKGKIRIVPLAK
eukprot:TRINITY_DN45002_c0_g1_i2.p1 TRINITY_DN45002_c0_g1~~TRINITY_DN45002_c0_g1_i2.p1  ORF type:complete len:218 (+),score=3.58 TRINITY_DN45002_c0_g1_i2:25-678(+)